MRWEKAFPDRSAPADEPGFWSKVGRALLGLAEPGSAGPPWRRPFGLDARGGTVYVADPEGHGVLRVDWDRETASPVTCPGLQWVSPLAVAAGEGGEAWVADGGAGVVVRVSSTRCVTVGTRDLERPSGLALGPSRLFVVDPPRHRVVVFALTGERLLTIGDRGEGPGQLNYPTAIALAPDGSLVVVDALNFRVSRFDADGHFLRAFGEPGDEQGRFARPKAVAVDARGRIFVSDVQRDVVLAFSADGEYLFAVGRSGDGPGEFLLPAGLAVSGNRLFVADSYNLRVQSFELLGGAP